jgi:hypothetical protein
LQASPDVYVVFAAAFEHVVAKLNSAVVCVLAVDSFPSVLGHWDYTETLVPTLHIKKYLRSAYIQYHRNFPNNNRITSI